MDTSVYYTFFMPIVTDCTNIYAIYRTLGLC
jgi:hypothetical protein